MSINRLDTRRFHARVSDFPDSGLIGWEARYTRVRCFRAVFCCFSLFCVCFQIRSPDVFLAIIDSFLAIIDISCHYLFIIDIIDTSGQNLRQIRPELSTRKDREQQKKQRKQLN